MLHLPSCFATVILTFAPLFFQRSWRHTEVVLTGAILTPGTRTVASILRISGLAGARVIGAGEQRAPVGHDEPIRLHFEQAAELMHPSSASRCRKLLIRLIISSALPCHSRMRAMPSRLDACARPSRTRACTAGGAFTTRPMR